METISKLTSKHKYLHNCSKLFHFKWVEMGAFRCFKVSKHKIYNILSTSALSSRVCQFSSLFMDLSIFTDAIQNYHFIDFVAKNADDKQTLVFIPTWACSIVLDKIRSWVASVCDNVWRISVSLHDISHEIVITPTTVTTPPPPVCHCLISITS